MPSLDVVVSCPVHDSFRVQQVAGMFDVPLAEKATERFQVELPDAGRGVGGRPDRRPVGQRQEHGRRASAFGDELYSGADWPADRAVIDCFGDLPVRQVVELFTAVGFSSPPSWVKPYQVLSCGERFRCDLARALRGSKVRRRMRMSEMPENAIAWLPASGLSLATCLSSSSTNSPASSIATSPGCARRRSPRAFAAGTLPCRFVAVTCHYDVAEWLEADWVLDMADGELHRRRLRRPRSSWKSIAADGGVAIVWRHHYLSGSLAVGARCYLATWDGMPVTFARRCR